MPLAFSLFSSVSTSTVIDESAVTTDPVVLEKAFKMYLDT